MSEGRASFILGELECEEFHDQVAKCIRLVSGGYGQSDDLVRWREYKRMRIEEWVKKWSVSGVVRKSSQTYAIRIGVSSCSKMLVRNTVEEKIGNLCRLGVRGFA